MTTTGTTGATTGSAASAVGSLMTSLGTGSGIDMSALATNLANAQFAARQDRLSTRSDTLQRQISAASTLKGDMLQLASALGDRVRSGDLSPRPQLADPTVAIASLTGAGIVRGSYAVEIGALATAQTLVGPALAGGRTSIGSGTLTVRFGTTGAGGFAADPAHPPVAIAIPTGASLSDAARAINAAGAGVRAYVAATPGGARLVLKGQEGAANGFVVDATENPGDPGLAAFAWNGSPDPSRLLQGASDAAVKVDGLTVSASGNTVAGVIPGVTLQLTGTNAGSPTQLTFADPSAGIGGAMQDLTTALNQIAGELRTDTDARSGDLARDPGARALRGALSQLAGQTILPDAAPGAPATLADLGLSIQRDGGFALDQSRLNATLAADPAGAAAMFTNGLHGVFATMDSLSRGATTPDNPASLAASLGRYAAQKTRVSADQTKLAADLDAARTRLAGRFAAADSRISASRSTLGFLQNQIAAWNAKG